MAWVTKMELEMKGRRKSPQGSSFRLMKNHLGFSQGRRRKMKTRKKSLLMTKTEL